MQWQVDDVMTRDVFTVGVDTPVHQVVALLDREGISAVPVTAGDGEVVGVISQADLLTDVADPGRGVPRSDDTAVTLRAGDVMTTPPLGVSAGTSLEVAARKMRRRRVRRLVVTDADGRLQGVVSRGDLLRPYARTDSAIRAEVEELLRRRLWIHPQQVQVSVDAGAATLSGTVGRRSTAGIAGRLVATVPGVSAVVDRIRYDVDDNDLVRSRVSRTHPFSADPFGPVRA